MQQLPLLSEHEALSPRMGDFAGWNMPLFYANATAEHSATREQAGIFDISHMGQVYVSGADAEVFLDGLFTNDVSKLKVGRSHYSFLLNVEGGVIDDLILYRLAQDSFFMVFNGARAEEAFAILQDSASSYSQLSLRWDRDVIGLSIQGPAVAGFTEQILGHPLPPKRNFIIADNDGISASTGYTGERGFEWFGPIARGKEIWAKAMELGVTPCGLVARDSLRLQAGLPLNGQDLARDKSPIAAGLGFAVKLKKAADFPGKDALVNGALADTKLIGFNSTGPIPRTGYEVQNSAGEIVGAVSSGGRPPGSKSTIGLAWIQASALDAELSLVVREKPFPLTQVSIPFM